MERSRLKATRTFVSTRLISLRPRHFCVHKFVASVAVTHVSIVTLWGGWRRVREGGGSVYVARVVKIIVAIFIGPFPRFAGVRIQMDASVILKKNSAPSIQKKKSRFKIFQSLESKII